ncbi:MAG: zinc ABC transporter substrate-binding protein [Candidatus Thiodiazotropha sp. L084R]
MYKIKQIQVGALLLALLITQSVFATPRIVVSVPAIHSLVANIMDGVGEPVLLYDHESNTADNLNPFQKSEVLTADLVIWVGAGLESSLSEMLVNTPPLESRSITLSRTIPLLLKKNFNGIADSRQISRDLKFWNDPKLAIMTVRQITPKLVRIDPDNTERYLDNEILLIKRIKSMTNEIVSSFSSLEPIPAVVASQFDQYYNNRFISKLNNGSSNNGKLLKVTGIPTNPCPNLINQEQQTAHGPDQYFETMMLKTKRIQACADKFSRKKIAETISEKEKSG